MKKDRERGTGQEGTFTSNRESEMNEDISLSPSLETEDEADDSRSSTRPFG